LRRTTGTTFPDNASATQEWNALDTVTQVVDPKGVKTQYGTNAFGEVTSETSPDIGTTTYQRDRAGNVIASTDARGVTSRITRDALGRPVEVKYDDQSQVYGYDAQGNVARIDDASGSVVYTRDAQGRVLTKTQTVNDVPSSPSKYIVQYGYTAGDLTSVKYPSGLLVTYRRTAGRITQVDVLAPGKGKTTLAFATNLAYTALGQPKSWNWFNGDSAARTFDADGRMTANEFASYGYDAASRITAITQQLWVNTGAQIEKTLISWTVGYDSRNRITSMVRNGQSTTFTYDANSNRLSRLEIATGEVDLEGQFDAPGMSLTTSETPKVDAGSNRLLGFSIFATATDGTQSSTATNDVQYAVDAAGNMTSDGLRKFTYNAANRLSKVEAIRNGDAMAVEYLHNALGQRVFKSDAIVESTESADGKFGAGFMGWLKSNFGWLFAPGQAGKARGGLGFVYDEQGNMLAAYSNGSNTAAQQQIEYIWLPQEDGTSIPIGAYKGGLMYAVHTDHLGTPRLITDGTNKPVWQWAYSAFGANEPSGVLKTITTSTTTSTGATSTTTQLKTTPPAVESNLRFPGQYWDSESYLSQNYFRMYCPQCGRYTQFDTLGLRAGLNGFLYVDADPLRFTDPTGLVKHVSGQWIDCGKGCRIRIDYTLDEASGAKIRHLHWECKGREGECGENGAASHGQTWDSAPRQIRECALRNGFNGAAEEPRGSWFFLPSMVYDPRTDMLVPPTSGAELIPTMPILPRFLPIP
jgi:RHS repeat-associated protein